MSNQEAEPDDSEDIRKLNKFIAKLVGNIASKDLSKGITFRIDGQGNLEIGGAEEQGTPTERTIQSEREPAYDVIDSGNMIQVVMEMPGVNRDDIRVSSEGRKLSINASNGTRRYSKEFSLPCDVSSDNASSYNNGVLEVKLKKAQPQS